MHVTRSKQRTQKLDFQTLTKEKHRYTHTHTNVHAFLVRGKLTPHPNAASNNSVAVGRASREEKKYMDFR